MTARTAVHAALGALSGAVAFVAGCRALRALARPIVRELVCDGWCGGRRTAHDDYRDGTARCRTCRNPRLTEYPGARRRTEER